MSNPQTYYVTYNTTTSQYQDLSGIFQPHSGGSKTSLTGFTVPVHGDLNNIFDPSNGSIISFNTKYTVNGIDLRYYFKPFQGYSVTDLSGVSLTTFNYNGYTGLIFDNTLGVQAPSATIVGNGTCNIQFFVNKNINVLVVGSGGGGSAGTNTFNAGGGGGGGGYIDYTFASGIGTYNIQVATAGGGRKNTNATIGNAGGANGDKSFIQNGSTVELIAGGGNAGLGIGTTLGYGGGGGGDASNNLISNTGGGGGGGGGGAGSTNTGAYNNVDPSAGALNTNYNFGNLGTVGTSSPSSTPQYAGGNGGNAHINSITPPFLSSGSIYFGNGGGGGQGGSTSTHQGGAAGSTVGGAGSSSGSTSGGNAVSGLNSGNYYYGNGGGGGAEYGNISSPNYGGDGAKGVVILWWQN